MKTNSIPNWLIYGILLIAAFLFVYFFSCTTSPLYEHHPFWFHGDSGIFQEMGICLVQGGTPYADLFDHKGPVLWFIQALGIMISPRWGIMALQILVLLCTLTLWYKSSILLNGKTIVSALVALSGLLFLMAFYRRGNLCEEWSLPFISLPIYIYLKRNKSTESEKSPIYSRFDLLVVGLCVGVLAMIRLNNTAPLIGFVILHFIRRLQQKEYRHFWTDVSIICGGIAIVFIVCSTFYLIKAGWTGVYEMIYGTFVFNFIYIIGDTNLPFAARIVQYVPVFLSILITIVYFLYNRGSKNLSTPLIISYIITLIAIGNFGYPHYMVIFIPLIMVSIGITMQMTNIWMITWWCGILLFTAYLGRNAIDLLAFRLKGKPANTELNDGFHRFISSMQPEERKSIYNAGLNHLGAGLFADENIYQCNRFIYKNHYLISKRLYNYSLTHGIDRLRPTWVLTQEPKHKIEDKYLLSHYIISDSIPGGEYDTIWCWHKKD